MVSASGDANHRRLTSAQPASSVPGGRAHPTTQSRVISAASSASLMPFKAAGRMAKFDHYGVGSGRIGDVASSPESRRLCSRRLRFLTHF